MYGEIGKTPSVNKSDPKLWGICFTELHKMIRIQFFYETFVDWRKYQQRQLQAMQNLQRQHAN